MAKDSEESLGSTGDAFLKNVGQFALTHGDYRAFFDEIRDAFVVFERPF
jgi:hypothetical protein